MKTNLDNLQKWAVIWEKAQLDVQLKHLFPRFGVSTKASHKLCSGGKCDHVT